MTQDEIDELADDCLCVAHELRGRMIARLSWVLTLEQIRALPLPDPGIVRTPDDVQGHLHEVFNAIVPALNRFYAERFAACGVKLGEANAQA